MNNKNRQYTMKHILIYENFGKLQEDPQNFEDCLQQLLFNGKASFTKDKYITIKVPIGNSVYVFFEKNSRGITRVTDVSYSKMGTLNKCSISGNLVNLEIQWDGQTNIVKRSLYLKDPECNIPKSKYIPLKKNQECVKIIQKALSEVEGGKYKKILGNFGPNRDGIDGHYGCSTLKAVIQFQKDNNIKPAIGIFGPITSGVLSDCLNRHIPYCGQEPRPASEPISKIPTKGVELIEKSV